MADEDFSGHIYIFFTIFTFYQYDDSQLTQLSTSKCKTKLFLFNQVQLLNNYDALFYFSSFMFLNFFPV